MQTRAENATVSATSTGPNILGPDGITRAGIIPHPGDTLAVQVTGTFTATIAIEATVDGVTWVALGLTPAAGGAVVTSVSAPGLWIAGVNIAAFARIRYSVTWTSGTSATITLALGITGR
jgi:hypothetical protein